MILILLGSAAGAQERVELASVAADGTLGNANSLGSSISADGRYIAFESSASNLVVGDTNSALDVFVKDMATGEISRVSVDIAGGQGTAESGEPAITADGRYIAFWSSAWNLVPGDTNGTRDVFVKDRLTGAIDRVSVAADGSQANHFSVNRPAISADGRYVAFESYASNLVPGDTNAISDIFVKDRQSGAVERANTDAAGAQANNRTQDATMSADGRYVAFASAASSLVADDLNGEYDVFVKDRQTGGVQRVSVAVGGGNPAGGSIQPIFSADARYVGFSSGAPNLVPGDTNGVYDVFLADRQTGTLERISVARNGTQANRDCSQPAISADGRYVAFRTDAVTLVEDDQDVNVDIYVKDRATGDVSRVSVAHDGIARGGSNPALSSDGRYVTFYSAGPYTTSDTRDFADVVRVDLSLPVAAPTPTATVTVTSTPTPTASPTPTPTPGPLRLFLQLVPNRAQIG